MPKKQKKRFLLFSFKSIRTTMNVSFFTLILFAVFVFMGISIRITQAAVLESATDYTQQLINQVNSDLDYYINYMQNIAILVSTNEDVRQYLSEDDLTKEESYNLYSRIIGQFDTVLNMRDDIYNIAVYGENHNFALNRGEKKLNPQVDIPNMDWYKKAIEADGKSVLSSSHVQNLVYDDYKWVVTFSKAITSKKTNEVTGALLVDLNYRAINNLCENISLGKKGYIFIIDENGDIIYHPKQQLIYSGIKSEKIMEVRECQTDSFISEDGDESKLYMMSKSEVTGWTVVGVANLNELDGNKKQANLTYFICAIVLLTFALFIASLFSDNITKPITALRNSMKEAEKGNFGHVALQNTDDNEIGILSNSFNMMTDEIQNLMEDKEKAQKLKYKLELRALQAQINPHFLYNTLDSIVWMAEGGKNEEVVIMTSALARLLRQSISNEEELVTIDKEVGYVKGYLTIQKMRYKDQLSFQIDVDKDILQYKVVKLILQPLVENAIYHGIKYKEGPGMVKIVGYETDTNLVLQVSDNGVGMDEYTLSHIFEKKVKNIKSNGVAVENVNSRIKLYYGESYGLTFESEVNVGTTVSIILPKEEGGGKFA